MKEYDHKKIEPKWQKLWDKKKLYLARDRSQAKKFYALMEFPYPSGDGLHTGHVRGYTAMDIIARKRRMEGRNVLYPIGWDAFGLPTESYAIKTGKQPAIITKQNTDNFRRQFKSLGMSFDWSREVNTTDPNYYKWTQWIFLKLFEKGLAYKAKIAINWCPKDKIGLANEEVIAGCCERCGTPVEKREKEQWMLAITKYAERLDKDLDTVDFLPQIKLAQRNWIGRSVGAEIVFKVSKGTFDIKVFTTRPDTIFGVTYIVLAPEHPIIDTMIYHSENGEEVSQYVKHSKTKDELERTTESKEKTGVEIKEIRAINPANGEEIPIFVADYVLGGYGTGAIMGVPADDERDREFAEKFSLPIVANYKKSGFEDFGKRATRFKLRDWVFSRQRYWGEPIPIIHCEKCGYVPVPEKDLPVKLPAIKDYKKNYQPTDSGESPLANITKWVNTKCPECKGPAKRETDTMPNWAGSSWYFLRYTDPKNRKEFASKKSLDYWTPVDWYNGGFEHTTLHLLYSRFWHKFLFDLGLVPTSEPYMKRTSHGIILAEGGEKMSKSRGNVINPDEIVKKFGADTLRLYEMFMGPFDQAVAWSQDGIVGPRRFLERVWKMATQIRENSAVPLAERVPHGQNFPISASQKHIAEAVNTLVKKVSEDIEVMKFNTAISALMIFLNEIEKSENVSKDVWEKFLKLLYPFAPHITEELWSELGNKKSLTLTEWPKWEESLIQEEKVKIVVQVNGKIRASFEASQNISEAEALSIAQKLPEIQKYLAGQQIKKTIFVPGRLINIVV